MSEFIDSFVEQLPERCQSCPVLLGFVAAAEASERNAAGICTTVSTLNEHEIFSQPELNERLLDVSSQLLEMATERELDSTRGVEALAKAGAACAGPKRGAPEHAPLIWKFEAYVRNEKVCRNPNL